MNLIFGIAMFSFALLGFVSFIGLIWSYYKKKTKKPWLILIFVSAGLFIGSIALYNHQLTPEERNAFAAQRERKTEQSAQKLAEQPPKMVQTMQDSAPRINTPESTLTLIANNKLGNNFKRLEVNDFVDDSSKKIVLVHYDGTAGWDNAMTKKTMLIQTADLFKDIFSAGIAIQEITAFIYTDMTGPNGSHKGLAMKCQLKGSTAANINWKNINKTKFNQNLDYIWMTPELRD